MEDNEKQIEIEPTTTELTTEAPKEEAKSIRETLAAKMDEPEKPQKPTYDTRQTVMEKATLIAPPADMKPEEKEAFSKLTPEMQAYLSRRSYEYQTDHTRKIASIKQQEQEYQELGRVLNPEIRQTYARDGITVPQIVERAIAWDRAFKTDRIAAAKEYLETYGVYPEDLLSDDTEVPQQEYLTREQAAQLAQEEVQKIIDQERQSQLAFSLNQTVQSFLSEKPLFKDPQTALQLEGAMAEEIIGLRAAYEARGQTASPQELLATAYDRVTKLHPTFSNLVQEQAKRQEAERQHSQALKAQAASRSIKGSPGQGTPAIKSGSIRESLERNLGR